MAAFLGTLALIALQNALKKRFLRKNQEPLLILANLELLIFLALFHFVLGGDRIFQMIPILKNSQAIIPLFSLLLYFIGFAVYQYTSYMASSSSYQRSHVDARAYTSQQLRMLIPFALPFILFMGFLDVVQFILPEKWQTLLFDEENHTGILIFTLLSLLVMGIILLVLPMFIQKIWSTVPMEDSPLKTRLEKLCRKAHFSCAGIMIWTTMNHALTAAIIGVIPRFRYVMFTGRLIRELPEESIEGILAHEIGHSYRKHLLILPCIIFGMVILAGLFSLIGSDAIDRIFGLEEILYPNTLAWNILYPFCLFVPYAVLIAVYFRYVFGYFSRLFERQADLHVYELGLSPIHLIQALDYLGTATGNTHSQPNWHHFSIQERIDFLNACERNPALIEQHHNRVKKALLGYALFFIASSLLLIAPFFPDTFGLKSLNSATRTLSNTLTTVTTRDLREKVTETFLFNYHLKGNPNTLKKGILAGLRPYAATQLPGIAEFYAAKHLLPEGEISAAAILMSKAWERTDLESLNPSLITSYAALTKDIFNRLKNDTQYLEEAVQLRQAYKNAVIQYNEPLENAQ